jgi:DNA-binding MarR family transcriptional regulator
MLPEQVARVRSFHRLVTQRAGALDDHFLGRDRPLGESRTLWEIGPKGAELRELRGRLGLDSGYLTRLVQALVAKGFVRLTTAAGDERVRYATLTRKGLAEYALMDRRSDAVAESILAPLTTSQRERLVTAMAQVDGLLRASGASITAVDPASPTARRCMAAYFTELDHRFEAGFDPGVSLPADDADLRPPMGCVLVAEMDGEAVACGAVKVIAPGVGSIKRMWVSPAVRGLGFGRRMLLALEDQARGLALHTVRLETNRALVEAISLYERTGYRSVGRFNDDPYADRWFEKAL